MQIKHIMPNKETKKNIEKLLKGNKTNFFIYLCMMLFAFTRIVVVLWIYKALV